MAKTVCKVLGVVFLLVGVAGFANQGLLGAHLTPPHNVVHIVSGVIALYFGFAGPLSGAKAFSLVFGVVYLGLGICGMAFGTGAEHSGWLDHCTSVKSITEFTYCLALYFLLAVCLPKPAEELTFRLQGGVR